MPDGAIRINSAVSQLTKEGRVTWFVGDDNYFSHFAEDPATLPKSYDRADEKED